MQADADATTDLRAATPRVRDLLEEGIEQGLHIGAQVHVRVAGEVVADFAVGLARSGAAMSTDSLVLWWSSVKPVVAIAFAQQLERESVDLDEPVATLIPQFAEAGKQAITFRHVLTHTGGFRATRFKYPEDNWETIIAKICATPREPNWTPGEKAGYHVHTGWFILAEAIQRLSGEPFPRYVRRHIFEPLGMRDSWIGMPGDVFDAYGQRIAIMPEFEDNRAVATDELDKRWVTHCRPSGNGYGPVRELARFYQMLLNGGELDGARIVQPGTVDLFTSRQRVDMHDHTFKHVMDWGLGFIPNNRRYGVETVPYGYGPHATDEAFGHSGVQSSVAFADPRHDLAAAIVCNGTPGEQRHQRRMHDLLEALYEDFGLAS